MSSTPAPPPPPRATPGVDEPAPPPLPQQRLAEPPLPAGPGQVGSPSEQRGIVETGEPTAEPPLPQPATGKPLARWRRLLRGELFRSSAGMTVSLIVHAVGFVLMSLFIVVSHVVQPLILSVSTEQLEETEDLVTLESPLTSDGDLVAELDPVPQVAQATNAPNVAAPWASDQPVERSTMLNELAEANLLQEIDAGASGGGFEGRSQVARGKLLAARGGTPRSEDAVKLGLEWLANHQYESGGWRLNHQKGECGARCRHPGTFGSTTGATGLTLLPFLGANHSSAHGDYREVVRRGIYYLEGRLLETTHGGDLQEGTMYSQGIATIALCENYALSKDPAHREAAQLAVDFICSAQHPRGGWRYVPGQPGDTTVTGWQLMALKSAKLAGLRVPSPVIERAKEFLGTVESASGAQYGYLKPGKDPGPTAVGLLMRMYTGWEQRDARLGRGVDYLATLGPSETDMYFNYYATQVMHHYEGPQWPRWNNHLREYLIRTQARENHERGSWHFEDRHAHAGGRLYTTALCVMILEVYYRHMPLYEKRSVGGGF
ncbi:MAG: terpene cyclase/mutase family protein [Planctomycetales bacterium]|nr:terpene cyclase/mutase family protein [Planctomycetales bacterium]